MLQVMAETDAEACEIAKEQMPHILEDSEYSAEILETIEVSKLWARGQWI
mgnify:FL=1